MKLIIVNRRILIWHKMHQKCQSLWNLFSTVLNLSYIFIDCTKSINIIKETKLRIFTPTVKICCFIKQKHGDTQNLIKECKLSL